MKRWDLRAKLCRQLNKFVRCRVAIGGEPRSHEIASTHSLELAFLRLVRRKECSEYEITYQSQPTHSIAGVA